MAFNSDDIVTTDDHVYHTGVEANGIVTEIDTTKKNPFKVMFPWAKYCDILHGEWVDKPKEKGTKWQWCSEDSLVKLDMPIDMGGYGQNKVTTLGVRSLDRLIRRQTGFKRRKKGDGSDIVISYGHWNHKVSPRVFVLNRKLICNKLTQMRYLTEELAPESMTGGITGDPKDWIIKPYISIGGKGIRPALGDSLRHGEYFQRKFNKVREFRVHCFRWLDNPVPFVQEKVIGDSGQLCWNKKQGGKFRYVYQDGLSYGKFATDLSMASRKMMTKMAVDALDKIGYDFGGIDFGMDSNGNFKIFEVNARMGLRERSFFTYKQAFGALRALNINKYKRDKLNGTA